jgi:hypothetical protein
MEDDVIGKTNGGAIETPRHVHKEQILSSCEKVDAIVKQK